MDNKTTLLLTLIVLGIVDIVIPVPVIGLILIYVVIQKPPWFIKLVHNIYKTQ
jgi:hypothetical protein